MINISTANFGLWQNMFYDLWSQMSYRLSERSQRQP